MPQLASLLVPRGSFDPLPMSAHSHSAAAGASRDARPCSSSDAAAHSATAAAAASASVGSTAAAAPAACRPTALANPFDAAASLAQELLAVKQRITTVEGEITTVGAEIVEARKLRDGAPVASELRSEHNAELQRLSKKEEQLRDELKQLRDKEARKDQAQGQPNASQCHLPIRLPQY